MVLGAYYEDMLTIIMVSFSEVIQLMLQMDILTLIEFHLWNIVVILDSIVKMVQP